MIQRNALQMLLKYPELWPQQRPHARLIYRLLTLIYTTIPSDWMSCLLMWWSRPTSLHRNSYAQQTDEKQLKFQHCV